MAEGRKHATYPELQRGGGQRLFVLAVEVRGRWNADSQALVRHRPGPGSPCAAGSSSCRLQCLDAQVVGHAVDCSAARCTAECFSGKKALHIAPPAPHPAGCCRVSHCRGCRASPQANEVLHEPLRPGISPTTYLRAVDQPCELRILGPPLVLGDFQHRPNNLDGAGLR